MKQIALDIALASGPTLANFFPGANAAALQHLQLWLGDAAQTRSPVPSYFWGPPGSGKSHLLRAVQAALQQQGDTVGWLDASVARPPEFSTQWSVVLLDEVHRYSASQQHAAFTWFVNAVSAPDGRPRAVLAAGELPPADLPLRDDLRSRLGWGHIFQLHLPDDAARRLVLQQHAQARGLHLADGVADFVLSRFSRDLGSLVQLLDALDAYALQTKRAITIPLIKEMLDNA